jgi:3',5'-cyclic AMP phosphodiesterase CpdA
LKVAVIGDVHLISDTDPYKSLHRRRDFFRAGWPSFRRLVDRVNGESPDLTILLGDLVDWFSPENVAFGLDLMSELRHPWQMTPGNHDIAAPSGDHTQEDYATTASRDHLAYWADNDVDLSNRAVDLGDTRLVLLDSALSDIAEGAEAWLDETLKDVSSALLFTHVPIDTPETREYILSVDARRNMKKYVLSGAPDLYTKCLVGRVAHIFTGHLHFSGELSRGETQFHLCNMGISMFDPHREQSAVASAIIIESVGEAHCLRKITIED